MARLPALPVLARRGISPNRTDHYVYILFRENGAPFYVGKGRRGRWCKHERDVRINTAARCKVNPHKSAIIRKMFAAGWAEVPKVKVGANLTAEQAFEYEVAWIAALGRGPDGPLVNLTDGGEGSSGHKQSDVTLAKRLGRKHSQATRPKMSDAGKNRPCSQTTRRKLSDAAKGNKYSLGRACSQATRQKMSVTRKAKPGRPCSQATRQKISDLKKGTKHSQTSRQKMSIAQKGNKNSLGARRSEATRQKLSAAAKARHRAS